MTEFFGIDNLCFEDECNKNEEEEEEEEEKDEEEKDDETIATATEGEEGEEEEELDEEINEEDAVDEEEVVEENERETNDNEDGERAIKITNVPQYTKFCFPRKSRKQPFVDRSMFLYIDRELSKLRQKRLTQTSTKLETRELMSQNFTALKDKIIQKDFEEKTYRQDISDSNYICPICKSKKVTFQMVQLRSADEPMDAIYACHECNHTGKNFHYITSRDVNFFRDASVKS